MALGSSSWDSFVIVPALTDESGDKSEGDCQNRLYAPNDVVVVAELLWLLEEDWMELQEHAEEILWN